MAALKQPAMRYFIRSLKTFVYFLLIFVIIVAFFVLSGMTEFNIETMFRNGYASLWQIAVILVLIAAVYPKVSYTDYQTCVRTGGKNLRQSITAIMQEFNYIPEKDEDDVMTFRQKNTGARLSRRYEDRITVSLGGERVCVEGLRKDVVRIVSRMEHRLSGND